MESIKCTFWVVVFSILAINLNAQWSLQHSGTTENLTNVFFIDNNTGWIVGENGILLKTLDGGDSWGQLASGTTKLLNKVKFFNKNEGYIAGESTLLFTSDGGNNWSSAQSDGKVYFIDMNKGWMVTQGVDIEYTIKVFRTNDGGSNWVDVLDETYSAEEYGRNIDIFGVDNKIWVFGSYMYQGDYGGSILKFSSDGESFSNISIPEFNWDQYVSNVFYVNENSGWLINGVTGTGSSLSALYNSLNGGANWGEIVSHESNEGVFSSIFYISDTEGWVSLGDKIYHDVSQGEPDLDYTANSIISKFFFVESNLGWAIGESGAILHYSVETELSTQLNFSKNINIYPNPANNELNVIGNVKYAEISFYSIDGKLILNSNLTGGSIDISELATGIFLLKINTEGQGSIIKRFVKN